MRNVWKITVDPSTMRFVAIERLTAGPGGGSQNQAGRSRNVVRISAGVWWGRGFLKVGISSQTARLGLQQIAAVVPQVWKYASGGAREIRLAEVSMRLRAGSEAGKRWSPENWPLRDVRGSPSRFRLLSDPYRDVRAHITATLTL